MVDNRGRVVLANDTIGTLLGVQWSFPGFVSVKRNWIIFILNNFLQVQTFSPTPALGWSGRKVANGGKEPKTAKQLKLKAEVLFTGSQSVSQKALKDNNHALPTSRARSAFQPNGNENFWAICKSVNPNVRILKSNQCVATNQTSSKVYASKIIR